MDDDECVGALIPAEVEQWVTEQGCSIAKVPADGDVEACIRRMMGWGAEDLVALEWADEHGELAVTWVISGMTEEGLDEVFAQDEILDLQERERPEPGLPN